MVDRNLPGRVVARFERQGADEIPIQDLPKAQQELVKHVGHKPSMAWEGIHGYIVTFQSGIGAGRFSKEFLHKIVNNSVFRWIESDSGAHGGFSIGM